MTEAEMIAAVAERLYRIDCEQHDWPYVPGNSTLVEGAEFYAERAAGVVEALRPALAPGWRPIDENTPRDGREIIALRSNGSISNAVWYKNPFGHTNTVINNATGKWWTATHWMPKPEDPKEGE